MKLLALIPARSGSKRLPDKNIKRICGHPLISYTIQSAIDSGIFADVVVSTDSIEYAEIAMHYGANIIIRPKALASDMSPDSEWIKQALDNLEFAYDYFFILRPTSPLRTSETIRRAWNKYEKRVWLKAVSPVEQHPDKMWVCINNDMIPRYHASNHLLPTQSLSKLYIQNGSLEIRPFASTSPSQYFQAFRSTGLEGYDINTERDWVYLEWLIYTNHAKLPTIEGKAWLKE